MLGLNPRARTPHLASQAVQGRVDGADGLDDLNVVLRGLFERCEIDVRDGEAGMTSGSAPTT